MFASTKGTPLNLNNLLNRVILPALRKAVIQWHGWHAFRRGLATNLYCLSVQDKTISGNPATLALRNDNAHLHKVGQRGFDSRHEAARSRIARQLSASFDTGCRPRGKLVTVF
jgi:hypothetical protein